MLNSVILQGRTTHHIELKHTKSGTPICRFSIAVQSNKNNTYFFDCTAINETAEKCERIDKGQEVFIVGRLTQREYKSRNGEKSLKTEVSVEECNFTYSTENALTSQISQREGGNYG